MKDNRYKFKINNNGFTLAEVLITLVIVGVVAALTISPLVNTYVESSTVAKVKKGLSTLAQAKKLAEAQNGSIQGWDFGDDSSSYENISKFFNYLKPYISFAKDCGNSTDNCFDYKGHYYLLNGQVYNYNESLRYKFILADGGIFWISTNSVGKCTDQSHPILSDVCAVFMYDVNGTKAPNAAGKDIFVYLMTADGVYPHLGNDCNKNSSGWGCSSYIIKHNNMNYLH